jgi:hypothetical protein
MTVTFEYPNKFTSSKIKTKTLSHTPKVTGLTNYLFRIKNPFEGININPSNGIIAIGKKAVPGNYILDIDCVDSTNNKIYNTKHIVFVRDPNKVFPGDEDLTDSETDDKADDKVDDKVDDKADDKVDDKVNIKANNKADIKPNNKANIKPNNKANIKGKKQNKDKNKNMNKNMNNIFKRFVKTNISILTGITFAFTVIKAIV